MNNKPLSILIYLLCLCQGMHVRTSKNTDDQDSKKNSLQKVSPTENANKETISRVEDSDENPEETAGLFEGDIDIDIPEFSFRSGYIVPLHLWPGGVVPYEYNPFCEFTAKEKETIKVVIELFKEKTCIRIREKTDADGDYVTIQNLKRGCSSKLGRRGGQQTINFQSNCFKRIGTLIHEFMHAIGIIHEQSRVDRDDYVEIHSENMKPEHAINFRKFDSWKFSTYGSNYDYDSVMHYSSKSFSKNGKATIVVKHNPNINKIGQRKGFSPSDVAKIKVMYNCTDPH